MAAFHSIAPNVDLEGPEDPMEVYPGGENDSADEDGIDIDIDLTTDHNEDMYDDQMTEDPNAGAAETNADVGLVQDEEMIDDDEEEDDGLVHQTAEDFYPEDHLDLDAFENPETRDQVDAAVDTAERAAQESEDNLQILPSDSNLRDQDHPVEHPRDYQGKDADISPDYTQPDTDEIPTRDVHVAQDISAASPTVSLDRPVINVHDSDTTPNHVRHSIHDTPTPSDGVTSGSQKPLTFVEEQQTTPRSIPLETFGTVAEIEKMEQHARATGGTIVEHARKSPSDGRSLQDNLPQTSTSKGENASRPHSSTQHHSVVPSTDVFQVREVIPNQSIASETEEPLEAAQVVQEIPHLHPVTVRYQDREMYLFPPTEEQKDHDKYFLSDEGLAAEGIQSLFRGFRDYLGGSISEMEELEIKIDALDLWISESNMDTANITLIQILDVYRQLHYNESNEPPESMHLTLLTNARFADKLKYLENLATEGVGLSQLAYEEDLSADDQSLENPQTLDEIEVLKTQIEIAELASANASFSGTNNLQPKTPGKDTLTDFSAAESTDTMGLLNNGAEVVLAPLERTDPENVTDAKRTVQETVAALDTIHTSEPSVLQDDGFPANIAEPQTSDIANEDVKGEEYYDDEEGFDTKENAYPNEEQSAGSSTIQGDDAEILKNDEELSNDVSLLDGQSAIAQQQLPLESGKNLEAEDVISYETDEEDCDEDTAGGLLDAENDLQWQDNEETDLVESELQGSEADALHNVNDTSFHASSYDNNHASHAPDDLDTGTQAKDQDRQINGHDNIGQSPREPDATVHNPQSSRADVVTVPPSLGVQMSVHSAEDDDDEITFDEEGEGEKETTDPAFQQPAPSSPTALKRGRELDDVTDIDPGQSKWRRPPLSEKARKANVSAWARHKEGPFQMSQL
ncbi:MAG: hypothetical protein Q9221_002328 [Calogaya cf. arnoldii]